MSTLSSKQTRNLRIERTRSPNSIEHSPVHPQAIALRYPDSPPKSSEINATTVLKVRRVPTDDNEKHTGCLSFFKHGSRRRGELGRMIKAKSGGATERSDVEHPYGAYNGGTQEPGKASLENCAKSEVSGQRGPAEYHRSSSLPRLAKQESVDYSAVSRDCRPL